MRAVVLWLSSAALLLCSDTAIEESRRLLRKVVSKLETSQRKIAVYGFRRRTERKDFSSDGRLKSEHSWVAERYRQDGFGFMRLLERDRKPLPEEERRQNEEAVRKRISELKALRPEQLKALDEQNRRKSNDEDAWIREFPDALDCMPSGEDSMNGRPATVLECEPHPGYRPRNLRARVFEKLRGRMWIDKSDLELVKADMEVYDTVNIGFGLVGRIEKGTKFLLQRAKVADDAWFATDQVVKFATRFLLFKTANTELTTRYRDFKRLDTASP